MPNHNPSLDRPGFLQRVFSRKEREAEAVRDNDEERTLEQQLDWSGSPRVRYSEAGELASGGWVPRDWGYGIGVRSGNYDYASEHAAIIRAIARFGFHDHAVAEPWVDGDEFTFEAYERGVPTWTEDHPTLWDRWLARRRSR